VDDCKAYGHTPLAWRNGRRFFVVGLTLARKTPFFFAKSLTTCHHSHLRITSLSLLFQYGAQGPRGLACSRTSWGSLVEGSIR
jgi:hypothetical protein